MKLRRILIIACIGLSSTSTVFANGFNWQIQAGPAWPNFTGSTQNIDMGYDTVNQYSVSTPSQTKGLFGTGVNYQWDYQQTSFNLGLSADYIKSAVSGINSPFINGGNFDVLSYSANDDSYALMFEPKLIWTAHAWQPYLMGGAGIAFNHLGDYNETPTDPDSSAVPTSTPFNSATTKSFAYEAGIGVQRAVSANKHSPIVALDYRFMDWGKAEFSTYTGQPVNNKLNVGHLQTRSANLTIILPI